MMLPRPALVAHCDWGKDAKKRYMAIARLEGDTYTVSPSERVGDTATLPQRLRADGPVLIGFDFPIGLPTAYAEKAGIEDFKSALAGFGDEWFVVCSSKDEITLQRPFYPMRPGGTSQTHLTDGLSVADMAALRRACERKTALRKTNACPLFWTLGGNQVGKGAITGWREVVIPLTAQGAALWPFDGKLANCLGGADFTLCETYPADACARLGAVPKSKRKQTERAKVVPALQEWLSKRQIHLTDETQLKDAFGHDPAGEDRFDAFVGLLGMLDVVLGHQKEAPPLTDEERRIEGWILGQVERG